MAPTKTENPARSSSRKIRNADAVELFLKWKESVGQSAGTINNVRFYLQAWMRDAKVEDKSPDAVTERNINDWINDADRDVKAATRSMQLAAIRSYFNFCVAKGFRTDNPAALVHVNLKGLSPAQ